MFSGNMWSDVNYYFGFDSILDDKKNQTKKKIFSTRLSDIRLAQFSQNWMWDSKKKEKNNDDDMTETKLFFYPHFMILLFHQICMFIFTHTKNLADSMNVIKCALLNDDEQSHCKRV